MEQNRPRILAPGNLEIPQTQENVRAVPAAQPGPVGENEIAQAIQRLQRYKAGKTNLELRVVEDEQWYKLRHWEVLGRGRKTTDSAAPTPASAWLFNAIANKHADAMDSYPEPLVLPREAEDQDSAKVLTAILPVILERNQFDQTYSDNWWEKLKHGTSVYGITWDNTLENGLGDVSIQPLDLLNLFWQPGVTDLQNSRDLFLVNLVDNDTLQEMYPDLSLQGGSAIDVAEYVYDDAVDTTDKSLVVDWYYKRRRPGGKCVLHYCKFVGTTILYASENDPVYAQRGWYDHGLYPVVLDTLFPEKGTPIGWGYVALCKNPQLYIDSLSANVLKNAMMSTNPRYFASEGSAINEEEFKDWSKPIIHVAGSLDENYLRQLEVGGLTGNILSIYQMKIDEMKETASNRDVSSGSTSGGVTAAAAIAALQEAGNKSSRDMIAASYRAMTRIYTMVIELIRQFYDAARSFRVLGAGAQDEAFVRFSNQSILPQQTDVTGDGAWLYRVPIFDLRVQVQKKNPFSQLTQNEMAKELYQLGFFNPQMAQAAQGALEMMEFEGKQRVCQYVQEGQTLQKLVEQYAALLQNLTGVGEGGQSAPSTRKREGAEGGSGPRGTAGQNPLSSLDSQIAAQTPYGARLAKNTVGGQREGGAGEWSR